ncbi:hypothetical protein ACUXTP_005673, partial [Klebsiella variicola]
MGNPKRSRIHRCVITDSRLNGSGLGNNQAVFFHLLTAKSLPQDFFWLLIKDKNIPYRLIS